MSSEEFEKVETIRYDTSTLVDLLIEVRATEDEYTTSFSLDYDLPIDFTVGASNKLAELKIAYIVKQEDETTVLLNLNGNGADELEAIIKFDGWMSLIRTLDVAAGLRIDKIEMQEWHPFLYWLMMKIGRTYDIQSNAEIEQTVRNEYKEYGIEF